jgi:hypothetical protein
VAVNSAGDKLSKQTGAKPVDLARRKEVIDRALGFLHQPAACDLDEAVANWDPTRIPRRISVPGGE